LILVDKLSNNFHVLAVMALVKISKVAEIMGVTPRTLRAWERSGELVPDRRSQGGVRYYDLDRITKTGLGGGDTLTAGYARVTGPGKEVDLSRQEELLAAFCAAKGWRHEVISDHTGPGLGSGLKQLIKLILYRRIRRLVLTRKDRLSRFGLELIFTLCDIQNIEIAIINQGDPPPLGEEEEDLAQDIELRQLCERLIKGVDAGVEAGAEAGVPQAPAASDSAFSSSGTSNAGGNGQDPGTAG
jgi:predicted site-specific integrase-resolvase